MSKICVIHPNLGIGGAERLMLDICKSLKDEDNEVVLISKNFDEKRCFDDTLDICRPLLVGKFIPDSIVGRGMSFFSLLTAIYISVYVILFVEADIVILDHVPYSVPFLRLFFEKVFFYCHFPDICLKDRVPSLISPILFIYDSILLYLESFCVFFASKILVNSNYTKTVCKSIYGKDLQYFILYPCINDCYIVYDKNNLLGIRKKYDILLTVGRFHPKKMLDISIDVFNESNSKNLLICGGFDSKYNSNHFFELLNKSTEYNFQIHIMDYSCHSIDLKFFSLQNYKNKRFFYHKCHIDEKFDDIFEKYSSSKKVFFVLNCGTKILTHLYSISRIFIYTPEAEHFGIAIIEAMQQEIPVVARKSGGPVEIIGNYENGILVNGSTASFVFEVENLRKDDELYEKVSELSKLRALDFNFANFTKRLIEIIKY
ncbi:alpha-1,3/1,6-mannosyltransferase [Hamiltosporidium tvaerminnensis]|uniref:Alpha-1,3/1,6-mannosyltransferase ALG2 n=1 Tax=Hamiltosporidium tvaerminnensis TaxID=1176355 RepID=A0A4Q9KWC1_9MICR|nr:Alpha-1,3-mannosyltransferase-like protein [Hamiltosporidium tvaerminnensis]TBT99183.1 alpha-1,3/1,6-mannosyltransferase [Hamiltosporidium tvaerminnensis]